MKLPFPSTLFSSACSLRRLIMGGCIALPAIATAVTEQASWALPVEESPTALSQALPTPLPPLPTTSSPTTSGEQYLVLVSGSSEALLQQVRQVEPGAFVNYVDGRSIIQAGRFSSFQNAQVRATELSSLGVAAEVQPANFSGTPVAAGPAVDYGMSSFPPSVETTAAVPVTPPAVSAVPSTIEFGQVAPFQTTAPSAFPPSNSAPPLNAPAIVNPSIPSGYYVVVPARTTELAGLSSQIVGLGAPASLVHARTQPRGPHIAIGPYEDQGIANEWTNYLRDSGIKGARVHFE